MNPQTQPGWYQLQANIPYVGQQFVGWLYIDQMRAMALQMAMQSCPGSPYRVLTEQGQPVVPQQAQPNPPAIPGWPYGWPNAAV